MGWRDINMNRSRPLPNYAVVPAIAGVDRGVAVLRKAAASATRAAAAQLGEAPLAGSAELKAFVAGYLLGFARYAALQDGVDCEAAGSGGSLADLARELAGAIPPAWRIDMQEIGVSPRPTSNPAPRARLRLELRNAPAICDAGYLVGHLEALCGARKLLALARDRLQQAGADAGAAYLTDCDVAADPMQTRSPTLSLRFDADERQVIAAAFGLIASQPD